MNRTIRSLMGLWLLGGLPLTTLYSQSPNIILILADDLGWKDVSYNGSTFYETPHIDRLAHHGMIFTNAYANAPVCGPSRAAIFSGQYAPQTGHYTNGNPARGQSSWRKVIPTVNKTLSAEKVLLAEVLPEEYVAGYVGKWHLGNPSTNSPQDNGYDFSIGPYDAYLRTFFSPYRSPYIEDGPEGEYLTDRHTSEAIGFIRRNQGKPFFLTVSYQAPHVPIQAKSQDIWHFITKLDGYAGGRQYNSIYAGMIKALDDGIGRILATLDSLELTDNTLVVFLSDNGGVHHITSMFPLRGFKGALYEGGIRIPMFAYWKGKIEAGSYCDEPVMGIDLYPTFAELTRTIPDPDHPLDGMSLVSLLFRTGTMDREAIFWHFPAYLQAGPELESPWRTTPVGAVRKGEYKLLEFFEDGRLELYNLRSDIGEQYDLSGQIPEKVKELHDDLSDWRRSLDVPYPLAPNHAFDPDSLANPTKAYQSRERIYLGSDER